MELVDTHCHLYLPEFDGDRSLAVQRARSEGVTKIFLPSIDASHFQKLRQTTADFPQYCYAMAGLHPCSVKADFHQELDFVQARLQDTQVVAIGEIGLDYYWDRTFEREQMEAFQVQMEWALARSLPIVIHTREAMEATLEVVSTYQSRGLKGIFHCFGGSLEEARKIIDLGFFLGIGGVLTYKKSSLPSVLTEIGLESLVLETDAPYLPPVPYRGKRNESSYLGVVAKKLAEVLGKSPEDVAQTTSRNALKIFGT